MLNAQEFVVRLISTSIAGAETLGVALGERWLPTADVVDDGPRTIARLLAGGPATVARLRDAIGDGTQIRDRGGELDSTSLLAPVPRPGKIVGIGRNYRDHAAEEGVEPPAAPLIFGKWPTTIVGPGAEVRWNPALTTQVDYEAELGVVIGRLARRVNESEALDYVLGYTCLNDISARDLQFGDGQWVRGKSLDTFCPIGPAIVTTDEIPDPQRLRLSCTVSGERLQDATTADMYFGVAEIVSYCSQAFTLEPGDVIATGTPSGVGAFRKPPRYLTDGDIVVVEIEGIGRLENTCRFETDGAAA
jgi:2-keto-4-pentenoate hydratase/2-oxohepta-3-ene-1,7-dioic acid hydratase in catechol pathway